MKQKLLLLLFAVLAAMTVRADVEINETTFPDAKFRNWVLSQEYGADGVLTASEISSVTSIDVYNKKIKSLQGIEYFTALKELYCYGNQLSALDVSKNTALTDLNCYENPLTALDVSKNTELEFLSCYQNQIKDEAMDALLASLPITGWGGNLNVIYNENEGNVMTVDQVAAAKAKGWTPRYFTGEYDEQWGNQIWEEYTGPDGIKGIDHSPLNIDHYYNLAGQRHQKMQKGIKIIGGKKVLVK